MIREVDEDFNKEKDLVDHYKKHNKEFNPPFKSMREYEETATNLARCPTVGRSDSTKHIIGFVGRDGRKIVYHREVGWLVVFVDNKKSPKNPIVITFYPATFSEYLNVKSNDYVKELPGNE